LFDSPRPAGRAASWRALAGLWILRLARRMANALLGFHSHPDPELKSIEHLRKQKQ